MIDLKKLTKQIKKQSKYSHILTKVVLGNSLHNTVCCFEPS